MSGSLGSLVRWHLVVAVGCMMDNGDVAGTIFCACEYSDRYVKDVPGWQ